MPVRVERKDVEPSIRKCLEHCIHACMPWQAGPCVSAPPLAATSWARGNPASPTFVVATLVLRKAVMDKDGCHRSFAFSLVCQGAQLLAPFVDDAAFGNAHRAQLFVAGCEAYQQLLASHASVTAASTAQCTITLLACWPALVAHKIGTAFAVALLTQHVPIGKAYHSTAVGMRHYGCARLLSTCSTLDKSVLAPLLALAHRQLASSITIGADNWCSRMHQSITAPSGPTPWQSSTPLVEAL